LEKGHFSAGGVKDIIQRFKMKWLKRLFVLALLAILIYLFLPVAKELRDLGEVLKTARWGWLAAAVAIQFVSYTSLAGLNILLLRPFPGKVSFWQMLAILPALAFIEVTVPSMGASGVVLRVRLLGRHEYSLEASTFTLVMEQVFIGVMLLAVSLLGLWYLVRMGEMRLFQIILLALIGITLLILAGAVVWFGRDRQRASRLLVRLNKVVNHWREMFKSEPVADSSILRQVDEFYQGLAQMRQMPVLPYWFTAFFRVSLDIACLGACFIAFHFAIPVGVLLTGYGLMLLVSGLSSIPGGLGMAELSLSVIYARLGAPGAVAVAAALTYRLIAWWLVRFAGFVSWQVMEAWYAKSEPDRQSF
jgi:putative heme transporter